MPTGAKAIILGLLTAIVGLVTSAVPFALHLETDLGLDVLFILRGPRPAPENVVVVSIDRESSDALGLPNEPDKWPRFLHGQLVRKLALGGARSIAFDIMFDEPRLEAHDRVFADAMREAGNVVLFEYLKSDQRVVTGNADSPTTQLNIETRIPPIDEFAQAAAALAPFPLPKVPNKVSQFWLFKTGAGDIPTLPVVAFHVYSLPAYPYLLPLISDLGENSSDPLTDATNIDQAGTISALAGLLRRSLQSEPSLLDELRDRVRQSAAIPEARTRLLLARLIELHTQDTRYLDFYGPPRTVTTIPYHLVLALGDGIGNAAQPDLSGKAVFVGFSERLRPEQKDGFFTVFSQPDGVNLSGVEIAATAFGNLLEGRSITPLAPLMHAAVVVIWGLLTSALFFILPAASLIPSAAVVGAGYLGLADWVFSADGTWPPLVVPLLLQLPLALLGALLWRYGDTRRERQKIRDAFGHYLPGAVVDELLQSNEGVTAGGRIVYGICLSTDAERYTSLSESLTPHDLRTLLNRYYKTLFDPVRRRGGFISDVVGDAMMALWAGTAPDSRLRQQACCAALDIIAAVEGPAARDIDACLPTRIGIHCGELLLGNVGAGDHYEYRAVGDIVNTATRIEGLNKHLGTRVLVSKEIVEDLDGIVSREVGWFRLAGKRRLLVIHELVGNAESIGPDILKRHELFGTALQAFRDQRWQEAMAAFETLLADCGEDGPSRYYLDLCNRFSNTSLPTPWDGVVSMDRK